MTAIEVGKRTECTLTDSARCSRESRTRVEFSVGLIANETAMTPSSKLWVTS